MREPNDNIELRGEEVQDILSRIPPWLIRWGSVAIFFIIILFFGVSYFLKYPTVMKGALKLTTQQQPLKIVNKLPGKIEKLYFKENSEIKAGDKLALIESSISAESIDFLKTMILKTNLLVEGELRNIDFLNSNLSFGDFQNEYNTLVKKVIDYQFFHSNSFYATKMASLQKQINHYKILQGITQTQLELSQKERDNAREKYNVDKQLFESKVISKLDFLREENAFIKQEQEVEIVRKYFEEVKITELEYIKQRNDLQFDLTQKVLEHRESIRQSLRILENLVEGWRQNYSIEAPIDGTIYAVKEISEKQHLKVNEEIFVIVPSHQSYVCVMTMPSSGYGKIKAGQKVRIKLDNFPFYEFGHLRGTVKSVPQLPFEDNTLSDKLNYSTKGNQYRVLVELYNVNKTTYNKFISFNPEMTGTGEVITDEKSVFERLFNQIRGSIN